MKTRINQSSPNPAGIHGQSNGFSVVELMITVVIVLIVAGVAVPKFMTLIHNAREQGAASDFANLLQKCRLFSVQSDGSYGVYFTTSGNVSEAFVDTKKTGTLDATVDPMIVMENEVVLVSASSAPNTSALQGLFLPTGSGLTVQDGSSSSSPIVFNSRGLPCTNVTYSSETLCVSNSSNSTAFWVFFQDNVTNAWEAVTLSPAGRIQKWRAVGSSWAKM